MQVGDSIKGPDLPTLVEGETGVFRAESPEGGIYRLEAKPGHSITKLQLTQAARAPQAGQNWSVMKTGEFASTAAGV